MLVTQLEYKLEQVSVQDIPGALGGRGLLSSLGLGLLSGSSRLGSSSGLRLLNSLGGSLRSLSGGGSGGLGGGGLRGLSDSLLLLVLGLHLLSSGRLALLVLVTAKESAEDRGALPAGRALALVLLGVSGLLLGLLLSLSLGGLGGGGSLSGRGGGALSSGGLVSSLRGLSLGLLLLLLLLLNGG